MAKQPKAKATAPSRGTGKAQGKTRKVRVTFTATVPVDISAALFRSMVEGHLPKAWKRTRVKAEDVGER